jgi:hypothetical protein
LGIQQEHTIPKCVGNFKSKHFEWYGGGKMI